jgi:hypothetical protein
MTFLRADFFDSFEDASASTKIIDNTPQHTVKIFSDPSYQHIIVPNLAGKCLLANYYKEKYGIEIFIISNRSDLKTCIEKLRQFPASVKAGFVINTTSQEGGHVCPIVYEKNKAEEAIYVFDSLGPKGLHGFGVNQIDELVNKGLPEKIDLYANDITDPFSTSRQTDQKSCINDAFVILKDVLREKHSMAIVKEQAKKIQTANSKSYLSFLLPEQWSKTVQRESYFDKTRGTNPDLEKNIHLKNIQSFFGEKKKPESLKQFRERYTSELEVQQFNVHSKINHDGRMEEERGKLVSSKKVKLNVYLKKKGYSNIARVEQQFKDHRNHLELVCWDRLAGVMLNLDPTVVLKTPAIAKIAVLDEEKTSDTRVIQKKI